MCVSYPPRVDISPNDKMHLNVGRWRINAALRAFTFDRSAFPALHRRSGTRLNASNVQLLVLVVDNLNIVPNCSYQEEKTARTCTRRHSSCDVLQKTLDMRRSTPSSELSVCEVFISFHDYTLQWFFPWRFPAIRTLVRPLTAAM